MGDAHELKKLAKSQVDAAVARAEHYRLLNDPGPAESICLDVLEVDPQNQKALVTLVLALSDQLKSSPHAFTDANEHLARLTDAYGRVYYRGVLCERQARAHLERGKSAFFAYGLFRQAMTAYEEAAQIAPPNTADPILRYNSCVRMIEAHTLGPSAEGPGEFPLE